MVTHWSGEQGKYYRDSTISGVAPPVARHATALRVSLAANLARPWADPDASALEGYCLRASPLAPPFWVPPPDLVPLALLTLPSCLHPFLQCRWVWPCSPYPQQLMEFLEQSSPSLFSLSPDFGNLDEEIPLNLPCFAPPRLCLPFSEILDSYHTPSRSWW